MYVNNKQEGTCGYNIRLNANITLIESTIVPQFALHFIFVMKRTVTTNTAQINGNIQWGIIG